MSLILYPHSQLIGVSAIKWSPSVNVIDNGEEGSKMEIRRISGHAGADCEVSWLFLGPEYKVFREWWKTTLKYGQKWFWMKLPMSIGLTWQLVRFVDENYKMTMDGHRKYNVQSGLEVLNRFIVFDPESWVPYDQVFDLEASDGGTTSSTGILVSGLLASGIYQVTQPSGLLYAGYSGWPSDDSTIPPKPPEGQYWGNRIMLVGGPGVSISLTASSPRKFDFGSGIGYPDGPTARAAFPGGVITGYTEYRLCIYDPQPLDNRGGASVRIERIA